MNLDLPIFVYGSLRHGMVQHEILAGSQFLGTATTESEFTLFDVGEWPAAIHKGTTAIVGELYGVNPSKLAEIDRYERHPDLFSRQAVMLAGGLNAWMWIYISEVHPSWPHIQDGCWRQH